MYNKIGVNKNQINCYNSNVSGLLSKRHFIYSAARLPYICQHCLISVLAFLCHKIKKYERN